MPLYEYRCLSCGKKFEWLQSFNDPPLATCPDCGQEVKKLISSPAFQFKGTGWYVTDYAGKKGAGGESGGGGADAKAESSDKSEKSEKPEKSEKSEKSETSSAKPAESKPGTPAPSAPKASSD